jgi:DNA polymerase
MKTLLLDIETYSEADLAKCGVDRYCEGEGFALLLFAYSVDYGPVEIIDVASGEKIPADVIAALSDDNVTKTAHNARFERICLSRYLGTYLDPKSWRCSMVACAYLGLPFSLEAAARISGAESQKMDEGRALIRCFSKPPRHYPWDDPVKWETFKEYCVRDVETEMAILDRIKKHPVPEVEWENYVIDQRINDRGIMIDRELVANALVADATSSAALTEELKTLTGLQNPNSPAQIKGWLSRNGVQTDSIDKRVVKEMITYADEKVKQVLGLRQELAKSSVSKYKRMEQVVCEDNRMRGLFQFYGASRTGRSAGRLVNGQNLPSSHLLDLDELRTLLKDGDYSQFAGKCESVPTALSELIRTAFIPAPGCKFICVDFSSIERVVLAWLAGEDWVLQAYAAKKDLYAATASQMFHVPIEQIAKGSEFRQKGKIGDLSC